MKKLYLFLCIIPLVMSCNSKKTNQADALEVIRTRTSIRAYTQEKVSDEDIRTLLAAGMAAPSAMNYQPWELIAVDDRAVLDSLAATNPYAKMLPSAPLAIVVCGETTWTRHGERTENGYWSQDCSAVTQNILLAAHAIGLGAVWTGCWPNSDRSEPVRRILGIPQGYQPLSVIVIGHPAESPAPKDKWKEEKIHRNKW